MKIQYAKILFNDDVSKERVNLLVDLITSIADLSGLILAVDVGEQEEECGNEDEE